MYPFESFLRSKWISAHLIKYLHCTFLNKISTFVVDRFFSYSVSWTSNGLTMSYLAWMYMFSISICFHHLPALRRITQRTQATAPKHAILQRRFVCENRKTCDHYDGKITHALMSQLWTIKDELRASTGSSTCRLRTCLSCASALTHISYWPWEGGDLGSGRGRAPSINGNTEAELIKWHAIKLGDTKNTHILFRVISCFFIERYFGGWTSGVSE